MAKALGQVVQFLQTQFPVSPEKPLPLPWGFDAFQGYAASIVTGQGTIVPVEIEGVPHWGLGLEYGFTFQQCLLL